MNKYQIALAETDRRLKYTYGEQEEIKNDLHNLGELVEKATPIRIIMKDGYCACPKCEACVFAADYCSKCGQALKR